MKGFKAKKAKGGQINLSKIKITKAEKQRIAERLAKLKTRDLVLANQHINEQRDQRDVGEEVDRAMDRS